ncbi:MAG: nucleotide sugar dehydrogenase [candidate division NC10 bacterium]|nr:nucleotide sugar dehydrogenase [candidate division NC10 bacterium]
MKERRYDMCVVGGLGHAGLPLGLSFAQAGKRVVIYDIDEKTMQTVSQGRMPFMEAGAESVLRAVLGKTLSLSSDKQVIAQSHFVVIVIGTPVDEHLNPKFTLFKDFFDEIMDLIDSDQHIILRSTVYPNTTALIKGYLESRDKKVKVSFCPERIAQGKAMEELRTLPQIVASFDTPSMEEAGALFSLLTKEVIYLTPVEAELAKLFTNCWRYIQFAISNQFYQIAMQHGLDFYRIYHAITHKYPRTRDLMSPGFTAGPCLFKDTMQLAAFSNNSFFLGHAAMLINEGLPNLLIQKLKEKVSLKDKTVGILGMAFKANSDDRRESLSYKLQKILEIEAGRVLCSDVYIQDKGFVSAEALVRESDIVILGAPHSAYAGLAIPEEKHLVDVWNFFGRGGQV